MPTTQTSNAVGTARQFTPQPQSTYQRQLLVPQFGGNIRATETSKGAQLAGALGVLSEAIGQFSSDYDKRQKEIADAVVPILYGREDHETRLTMDGIAMVNKAGIGGLQDNPYALALIDQLKGQEISSEIHKRYDAYTSQERLKGTLEEEIKSYDEFFNGEYTFNEYVSTSLGLRYNYSNIYSGTPNPRFYVNVNPTSWWTIKAGIANGMKIPSITQLGNGFLYSDTETAYYGNPNLQAEKSWNYELSTIFDVNPGFFTLTAFYTDFRDKVYAQEFGNSGTGAINGDVLPNGERCTTGSTCVWYTNVDKALTRGLEASFEMNPIYGIGFNINYTFADSKQLSGAQMGLPVNYLSKHTLNTKLSYKPNSFFDTYVRVQGKFMTPINQTSKSGQAPAARALYGTYYKDYAIVDLGFNFHLQKELTLSAVVNNLFDVNFADIVETIG